MTNGELKMVDARPADYKELAALLGAALYSPQIEQFMELLGVHNFREVRQGEALVAGLGYVPMGQWFGGVSVPCVGISAVGVAPEQRASGVGSAMLRLILEELYEGGTPLSSLYPATLPFYQRAGFERAGQRVTYELPLDSIDVREHGADMVPITESDYSTLHDLYNRRALHSSGNLDRPAWMWQRKLESEEHTLFRFLVVRNGTPEGYVIYRQGDRNAPIYILDVCVLTPQAGRRVLTLFAGHKTMVEAVTWASGPLDPLVYLLREPVVAVSHSRVKTVLSMDWMLRLIDVPKALSLRGYPPNVRATLHLDIRDDNLPVNNGRSVLDVAEGHAQVRSGGDGRITLHVRDLAALYSGFMSPHELRTLGTLDGDDHDLVAAATVFAGPRPWIADMF